MNFSDKIRKIRKQLGITQEKLADDLGVSFATINRLEQGLTMPQTSTIRKLEEYCMNKNIELNDSQPQNIGFELIHATDIEDWASKNPREMQGLLPELVSNLIKESLVNESYELNFPHGDKIYMDGYDGFLKVSGVVSQFVPDGKSIWELGATTKTSTQKICDDYHKRDTQVSIEQKKDNTFILVTLKSFSMQSVDKIKNNIGGGAWKEVRIYTANTLADWLAHNLGTSVWFYEKICNNHLELDSIQRAWDKMSKSTSPSLSCKLFTIGRTSEIEKLNNNIETQKVVTVAGPSRDESFGFVLSSLLCNSSQKNLARAIVCNDYVSLQQINSFVHNKIIILNFNLSDYNFYGSKNTIIIINGKDVDNRSTIDIQLNQRPQSLLFDVLKDEMKVSQRKLSELSHKVNNSVFLIIRELEDEVAHSTNVWRKSEKLLELIPLLIVGKVNVKSESDKTILSKFLASGQSPDQYLSVIKSWENVENSPIFVYGDYIRVSLKEELWCSLNIDEQTVATLLESIKTIFTTINPKYELPADQQFAASVYNKNWTYNEYTVQELLDSCILLAIHNNKQDEINWLFKDILDGISTKETFFTIADYMKQIAECSPETFTSYIEKEVEKDDSIIWELFKNNDSSFLTGGHDYCKLLWALELLTELDKYKFRACTILFKLTLKKYKYTISNSPTESLENILWLYNNRTALCASEKTDFMEYGIKKYKQDFIRLALKTILKTTGFFSGVALKWRNAEIAEETISYPILFNAIDRIIKVSLENLCFSDTKILESLVNNNSLIPFETFNAIIDYILQTYKPNTTESTELYEYMLNTQYNMVRYKDNNSQKYLNLLSSVVSQLKPTDELEASLVYFKHFGFNNCPIIEAIDDDFRAQEKKAFVCLNKMLADLMTKYDHIKVLTRIIQVLPNDGYDGVFLLQAELSDSEKTFLKNGLLSAKKYQTLSIIIEHDDEMTVNSFLNQLEEQEFKNIMPYIQSRQYVPTRVLQSEENLQYFFRNKFVDDTSNEQYVSLIKKYNPGAYLTWIAYKQQDSPWDLNEILSVLNNICDSNIYPSQHYAIEEVINKLDNQYYSELLALSEYKLLPILDRDNLPNGLRRYFFENPLLFLQIIDNKYGSIPSNIKFDLLFKMRLPNKYEESQLTKYVTTILEYANGDSDRDKFFRQTLGGILARSFGHYDKEFLPLNLKKLLEIINDDEVNKGVYIGYQNSRGVRTITGDFPELEEANKMDSEAKQCEIEYPVAAKLLREFAESRRREAEMDKQETLIMDGIL